MNQRWLFLVRSLLGRKLVVIAAALSVLAVVGSLLAAQGIRSAHAAPTIPAVQTKLPTDFSYYMEPSGTPTIAYNLGCDQGKRDRANGKDSLVILDFGAQTRNGSGTYFAGTQVFISNSKIEANAEAFARGYFHCTASNRSMTLAIGTNNSGVGVGAATGRAWAHVVSAVQSYLSSHIYWQRVSASGAADIESWCSASGCASASAAINWAKGYHGALVGLYYNFGSADGCPENSSNNGSCSGGWNQYDYWYLSWGNPSAVPVPEIYNQTGAQAREWDMISLYSVQHHGGPIVFQGPMDQHNINGVGCCSGVNNTSTQAWDQLWNALHSHKSTAQSLYYSVEIKKE